MHTGIIFDVWRFDETKFYLKKLISVVTETTVPQRE